MNPFALNGPAFLVFYTGFAAAVLIAYWRYANFSQSSAGSPRLTTLTADPYRIAYLRGGEPETVRVAIVNLIDRGLLENNEDALSATGKAADDLLRRPLEQAILARCAHPATCAQVLADPATSAACAQYALQLQGAGLLRSDDQQASAYRGMQIAVGLLVGVAAIRIYQAISHGRYNILFLVLLAAAAVFLVRCVFEVPRTRAGIRMIRSLAELMRRLKSRAGRLTRGGATQDALLLAAVYGLYALPAAGFPFVTQLFPRSKGGFGSSSVDSGGSSCSGSCGGGGGCGGCGGD